MHLSVITGVLLFAAASVQGGVSTEKTFMLMPGDDGKVHLAILRGPMPEIKIDPINDITFYLYTRSNQDTPVQIFVGDLNGANYDPSRPTKFITHGFSSNGFGDWQIGMKNAYLRQQDCNVICVDWSGLAAPPLYNVAKANAKPTGQYVGEMVDYLVSRGGSTSNFHLIGHSLGAHVSGFAGKVATTGKISRITGMDPALPLFDLDQPNERLSDSDAGFVDVIHTCSGWLGFKAPIGHVDFYPNGGGDQPGCGIDLTGACSHGRSCEFYVESVESSNFRGVPCDSWDNFQNNQCSGATVAMGLNCDTSARGTYYLATSGSSPFALG